MVVEILCVTQQRKAEHTMAYVSIYAASKVQNLPARTIYNRPLPDFTILPSSVRRAIMRSRIPLIKPPLDSVE